MSVWVSVRWMKVKGTHEIVTVFNFIDTNPYGGCQHDTRGVLGGLGGRGLPI